MSANGNVIAIDRNVLGAAMDRAQDGIDHVMDMLEADDWTDEQMEKARDDFLRAAMMVGAWPQDLDHILNG